jgi:hypothetical protein
LSRVGYDCGHCLGCVQDAAAPDPYDDLCLMASSRLEPRLDIFWRGLTEYLKQANITTSVFQSIHHCTNAFDIRPADHQDTSTESAHDVWELRDRARTENHSL